MTSGFDLASNVVRVAFEAGIRFSTSTCFRGSDLTMGVGSGSLNSAVPFSCKALGLGGGGVMAPLPGVLARASAEGFQRSQMLFWSICWYR